MDTKNEQPVSETSEAVIAIASLFGAVGVFVFGGLGLLVASRESFSVETVFAAVALTLIGGALGAGFVGLCVLLCGVELDGRFTYPFTIGFCGWLAPIAAYVLVPTDVRVQVKVMFAVWIAGTIVGVIGGWLLAGEIRGYGRRSRVWVAVGAVPMLLFGAWFMITNGGLGDNIFADPLAVLLFLIGLAVFAVLGGAPGAVLGAILDRRAGRTRS
ncbi:MAG: hypothetical protein ISS69_09905 [Phycisphaerae bacterium]|nr:hypothetical protein [Phycisphaerae bacterium]